MEEKKKVRGKDSTGAKRQTALRARKPRVEAFMTPEEYREVELMLSGGVSATQADLVRQALHEKYLRWVDKKA